MKTIPISPPQALSVDYLLEQGSCCGSGCQNCPYIDEEGNRHQVGETHINRKFEKRNDPGDSQTR